MEQTLVLIKPDAVMRGIIGELISRFEKIGLKIVAIKMIKPDKIHFEEHYETIGTLKTRKGDDIFNNTLSSMQEGPVIAIVLEGVNATEIVRKMVGATEPKSASPGTIRGDYAHVSFEQVDKVNKAVGNIVHASANTNEAKKEIKHWFKEEEIYNYTVVHEQYTQPKP